jgi:WD40 repeat protein
MQASDSKKAMMTMAHIETWPVRGTLMLGLAVATACLAAPIGPAQTPRPEPTITVKTAAAHQELSALEAYIDPLPPAAVGRLGTRRFVPEGKAEALAFTADGKTLVAYTKAGVFVWDAATGRELQRLPVLMPYGSSALAIAPDGFTLAVAEYSPEGDEARVGRWDLRTGQKAGTLTLPLGEGPLAQIDRLSFALDGQSLALSCTNKGKALVFDVPSGQVRAALAGASTVVYKQVLSPDGRTLAAAVFSNEARAPVQSVQLWDLAAEKPGRILLNLSAQGRKSAVGALTFAPDGKTLAIAVLGSISLYDMAGPDKASHISGAGQGPITSLAFTRDGKKLVSTSGDGAKVEVRLLDPENGLQPLAKRIFAGQSLAWSEASNTVAIADVHGHVKLWDLATGKELFTRYRDHDSPVKSLAFSRDGTLLVSTAASGQVLVWDLTAKQKSSMAASSVPTLPAALAGKTTFKILQGRDIGVHDGDSGLDRVLRGPEDEVVLALAPSPDARVLATATWGPRPSIRLVEVVTGKEICRLQRHEGKAVALAWSQDGRLLVSGEQLNDSVVPTVNQTVRLWDSMTGQELARFGGFKWDVATVAFSPNEKQLFAGLNDGTILLWEVAAQPAAASPGKEDLEALWKELALDEPSRAHKALWSLVGAPKESVPFLRGRLKPVDGSVILKWIADLNSQTFVDRDAAANGLIKAGAQALGSMQTALKNKPSLETHRRLVQILKSLPEVPDPDTVRTIRAIMVLERIGSTEAQAILESLAGGAAGARDTDEAKGSLDRLGKRKMKL